MTNKTDAISKCELCGEPPPSDIVAPQPQPPSATSDDVRDKRIAELEAACRQHEENHSALGYRCDKAEAAFADARDKALEEAAKVCDGINHQYTSSGGHAAERCAAAIRALRTTSGNAIAAMQGEGEK